MRFTFTRDFYVPKGAVKIADKQSDAVAYVREYKNSLGSLRVQVVIFWGKQNKPLTNFTYGSRKVAEIEIASNFESRRKTLDYKKGRVDAKKAFVHSYKVGDMLYTSWGYDQTNVEFFQIVDVRGKHVMLRQIGGDSEEKGYMTGECSPTKDSFLSRSCVNESNEPFRRLAQEGGIKIDSSRTAWLHKTGTTHRWSSYA